MLPGDSHMMLFLSFRRVAGSSLGVCGVPRAVEALVESLSKASMSGDWGELSMRLATSALWYCCRVTWAHRHGHPAQGAPSPTSASRRPGGSKPPDSRSECRTPQHPLGTHQAPGAQRGRRVPGQGWPGWDSPCQPCPYLDELHVAEDVHGVVGRVDVVAAAVELRAAAPKILPVGGLGAVEATAAGRGPVHCRRGQHTGKHTHSAAAAALCSQCRCRPKVELSPPVAAPRDTGLAWP